MKTWQVNAPKISKKCVVSFIGGIMSLIGCSTLPSAEDTFIAGLRKAAKSQHEFARTQKVCTTKEGGKYSSDCAYKAGEMATIECILDNHNKLVTKRDESPACKCFKSSDADQIEKCSAWIESGK